MSITLALNNKNIYPYGYTIMELILVIVILGVLSFFAVPKFFDILTYQKRSFYDETASALRYAQELAVAKACPMRVRFRSHEYKVQQRESCKTGAWETLPASHPVSSNSVDSVTIKDTPIIVVFDALGRCQSQDSINSTVTINVGGRKMSIYQETGYVNATS